MITNTFLTLAFLSLVSLSVTHVIAQTLPEGWCSVATTQGYACKEYTVTTDDGYILSIQRIPEGRAGPGSNGSKPRQPVLLQHGLLVDGMTWLMNSPEQSLGMVLADSGYDVWISNIRGTKFSRRHVTLNPIQPKFWKWSWADIADHDIPAVIGLVFKETGQQMHYVGHSMGTMVALASMSEGKFQNVKSAALLCPIAHLSHVTSPMALAAANYFVGEFETTIGVAEYNPSGPEAKYFLSNYCTMGDCSNFATMFFANDCCVSPATAETFIKHYPQSSATKNMVHFAQGIRTGVFAKFDYGNKFKNMFNYGLASPPVYNVAGIAKNFPLFISHGGQDDLSVPKDVAILIDDLKTHNRDKLQVQFLQQYSHIDFIIANNAKDLVYTHIIDFFRKNN